MRRVKKLSEILEECIEAGIAGRRSLEESLALYPAQAEELEPLLRTALSVSDSFQSYTPPAAVEQRIRSRFLADAAARRNLRHLEGSIEGRGWFAGFFRKPVFGGFAAAAAVAVAVVAIAVGGVNLGGSENGGTSETDPLGPTVVFDLGKKVNSLNEHVQGGGQVQTADVTEITTLVAALGNTPIEDLQGSSSELETTFADTLAILEDAANLDPGGQDLLDAEATIRTIAADLDLDLPGPVDVGDATPTPTDPSVEPTDDPVEPTDVPAEPTSTPSGGDVTTSPSVTPQPTPTSTDDNRSPPGFLP